MPRTANSLPRASASRRQSSSTASAEESKCSRAVASATARASRLARTAGLHARTLQWLRDFRFTGDVEAMPEGTPFFADEPILRVTAPLPQAAQRAAV